MKWAKNNITLLSIYGYQKKKSEESKKFAAANGGLSIKNKIDKIILFSIQYVEPLNINMKIQRRISTIGNNSLC
jgi:hypothetical protein